MTQARPLPVRVPLVTEPVGMLGSQQMARRNPNLAQHLASRAVASLSVSASYRHNLA